MFYSIGDSIHNLANAASFTVSSNNWRPIQPQPPSTSPLPASIGLPKWRVVSSTSGNRTAGATLGPHAQPRKATLMTESGPQEVLTNYLYFVLRKCTY